MSKKYSVEIFVGQQKLKYKMSEPELHVLEDQLEKKNSKWIELKLAQGDTLKLKSSDVVAVRKKQSQSEGYKKLPGVTVRDICKVASDVWSYSTLIKKIQTKTIKLSMLSARKIDLSESNRKILGLTKNHYSSLLKVTSR